MSRKVRRASALVSGKPKAVGLAPEGRPFSPHVTLARIKEGGAEAEEARAQILLGDAGKLRPSRKAVGRS